MQHKPGCSGPLEQQYGVLMWEKEECRRLIEDIMRENELKSRECREAQEWIHYLQTVMMTMSMQVGSLSCSCVWSFSLEFDSLVAKKFSSVCHQTMACMFRLVFIRISF